MAIDWARQMAMDWEDGTLASLDRAEFNSLIETLRAAYTRGYNDGRAAAVAEMRISLQRKE